MNYEATGRKCFTKRISEKAPVSWICRKPTKQQNTNLRVRREEGNKDWANNLKVTSQKKIHKWSISIGKLVNIIDHHNEIPICIFQNDYNLNRLMTPNIDELVEQLEFLHKLLVGMQNGAKWCNHLEKIQAIFKTWTNLPYGLAILLLENWKYMNTKGLCKHVHSRCSYNS